MVMANLSKITCDGCNGGGTVYLIDIGFRGMEYKYKDNCLKCGGTGYLTKEGKKFGYY